MTEQAPDSAPPPRLSRWQGGGRWLLVLCVAVVLCVAGLVASVATESGSRALLGLATRFSQDALRVEGWQGNLLHSWRASRVQLRLDGLAIDIDALAVTWQPWRLLHNTLRVDALAADALSIRSASSTEPASLPRSLELPLAITVLDARLGYLAVGSLVSGSTQPAPDVELQTLKASLRSEADRHVLSGLAATIQGLALSGEGEIATRPPFALKASVSGNTRLAERSAQLRAEGSGDLQHLQLNLHVAGDGLQGEAQGALTPFEAMPLRALKLAVTGLDPALFHASAPRALLDITTELKPDAATSSPATLADWRVAGRISVRNRDVRPFDRGGLPLQQLDASLAWGARRLQADAVHIVMGDGSLKGKASWQERKGDALGQIDSDLQLRDVRLEKLVAALRPLRIDGQVLARTGAEEQRFEARLSGRSAKPLPGGKPLTLQASGLQRAGGLMLERAELNLGSAQATASGRLELNGKQAFSVAARLAGIQPQQFSATAPSGVLNIDAQLSGVLAPAWRVQGQLVMGDSMLDGYPLTGRGSAVLTAQRLSETEVNFDVLGNTLHLSGNLGLPDDRLNFTLDASRLAALWDKAQGRVQASGFVGGRFSEPWGQFEASANGLRTADGLRLESASLRLDLAPGAEGKVDLHAEARRLVMDGKTWLRQASLKLNGTRAAHAAELTAGLGDTQQLRMALAGGLFAEQWRGKLNELSGQGPATFNLPKPAELELGAQRVRLESTRIESAHGLIELLQTEWSPELSVLRGRLRGLQVGLSVDEFQRTVMRGRNLSLGGEWDVTLARSVNGLVRLFREDGDLVLQGDTPLALGLDNLDIRVAAQDGRVAASANISGSRIGLISAAATAAAEREGWGLRLLPDGPLVGVATIDIPSIAWLGPVMDQNLRTAGRVQGEFNLSGTAETPVSQGRLTGSGLELALADQGMRLTDGKLLITSSSGVMTIESLVFRAEQSLPPPDVRATPSGPKREGKLTGRGGFSLRSGEGELVFDAERVPVLQNRNQWMLISGLTQLALKPGYLKLDSRLRADGGYVGVPKNAAPTLSSDVVILGQQDKPPHRLRLDARISFDMGEHFYMKAYGIDTRLDGKLELTQEDGKWALRGTIDAEGGHYAAYGQRLSIERGTVSFSGAMDNPALNVIALRKGYAVEAGVEVTGSARAPRVRLISDPVVPNEEKLSWLLLGRASDAGGADSSLLLMAASAALGEDGEGLLDQVVDGMGLDQLSLGQGTNDITRSRTSRVASTATGTASSAGKSEGTAQDQVLTIGKRLSARAFLSLEQSVSGTESAIKLTLFLSRFVSLIARAGTENSLDVQYSISFR